MFRSLLSLLRLATSQLGSVSLLPPEKRQKRRRVQPGSWLQSATPAPDSKAYDTVNSRLRRNPDGSQPGTGSLSPVARRVDAGRVPPAVNAFDIQFPFATRFNAIDWKTGKSLTGLMLVETRPSMLYSTLFSTLGEKSGIFVDGLIGIAIFFGMIELIALLIGMRLTRSMTKSVADLYDATQRVNRGDLKHRIKIRTDDQMAALEQSFNSMTESLSKPDPGTEGEAAVWKANWPSLTRCRTCSSRRT